MDKQFEIFSKKISNPVSYRLFLLSSLPLVYFTGIKIASFSPNESVTTVRYSWLNKNPFRSMYFAVMGMAAELSTGVLCMGNIYGGIPMSMLIVKSEAVYHKKAVGKVSFRCTDGTTIREAINRSRSNGEAEAIRCYSAAISDAGELVAEFWFTWSIKRKKTAVK
jgi:hypothetical protein